MTFFGRNESVAVYPDRISSFESELDAARSKLFGPSGYSGQNTWSRCGTLWPNIRVDRWKNLTWSSTTSMDRTSAVASLQDEPCRTGWRDQIDVKGVRCKMKCAPTELPSNTRKNLRWKHDPSCQHLTLVDPRDRIRTAGIS